MTELARVVEVVAAPAEALWALVADFGAPQKMAASIERCDVSGTGVGAVRIVHARGLVIHERLVEIDPRRRRMRYEILPTGDVPFPGLTQYVATVVLTPLRDAETRIDWSSDGRIVGDIAPVTDSLVQLYAGAISRLRELTRDSRQLIADHCARGGRTIDPSGRAEAGLHDATGA